jgi:murein DD-endopeptidase MepM/ murein hydrolase activator NlpD
MPPAPAGPLAGSRRRLLPVLLAAAVTLAPGSSPVPEPLAWRAVRQVPPGDGRVPWLRMPVGGPVVRGFEAPSGPYGAGHRGVDLAAPVGRRVRAPAAGRVLFAGPVAGRVWVSLLVAPGVVVTVGPLLVPAATVGRRVPALQPVGRLGPGHAAGRPGSRAGPAAALHLSLRVDGVYVDPLPYLLDRPRARLAPLRDPGGLARA